MPTYRQRVTAQAQIASIRVTEEKRTSREYNRRMCLSACECYCEGYERGIQDWRDEYRGAIERIRTLGDDYAWPESYRNGYVAGFGE